MQHADPVVTTGQWVASIRAEESRRPDAFRQDQYAHLMAGAGSSHVADIRAVGGPIGVVPARLRLGDLTVLDAVEAGIRQVVLLAAGTDTRAYRLELPADTQVFELDLPGVIAWKDQVMAEAGVRPRGQHHWVEADLRENWELALEQAGFDRSAPAVWVLEGLFYYLSIEEIQQLLARLSALAAPGSVLTFDAVDDRFMAAPENQGFRQYLARNNALWRSGLADPEALLTPLGWQVSAYHSNDLGTERAPWAPEIPERLRDSQYFWLVRAERTEQG